MSTASSDALYPIHSLSPVPRVLVSARATPAPVSPVSVCYLRVHHGRPDRTPEFRTILAQAQKRQRVAKPGPQQQPLLSEWQKREPNGHASAAATPSARSEFARNAAHIGRGITATMGKLERLAQLARRKAIFDDRPVEISELTYVVKQDLAALNQQISSLQLLTQSQHPTASQPRSADQEGQHHKTVVLMLQNKVTDVAANFKDVLEMRTKNMQASRSRTENFVSALLLMEEAQPTNTYIQERGQAIEAIEKTITELGSIFGQLAGMVQEQGEMLQRIDANTDDVVDNVHGAQRELLKYWNRVQGNRWLVAKMMGVLMVFFLIWVLIAG
ncbi:hypothetical protein DV737_g2545, partial [Chaetothyriales sp. CBS 132003]